MPFLPKSTGQRSNSGNRELTAGRFVLRVISATL